MTYRILITSIGGCGVGSQILASLKHQSQSLLYIIGTDICSTNVIKDRMDVFYVVPLASDPCYYDKIMDIVKREKVNLIMPASLPEMDFFLKHIEVFRNQNIIICCNNYDTFSRCRYKSIPSTILSSAGVVIPQNRIINTIEDCLSIDFYPIILKPDKDSTQSSDVAVAFNQHELQLLTELYLSRNFNHLIAQEWIIDGEEISASVMSDEKMNVIGICTVKRRFETGISYKQKIKYKGRYYYISSGITEGEVVSYNELNKQLIKISQLLKSTGPLNLQGIWKNNTFFLFDIHAAITSGCYVRALAGYNEPLFWINKLLGLSSVSLSYKNCRIIRELRAKVIE